tara:strand:- start:2895 stop:5255 length:2361 start_codon:yes stop_codon:yes gene_type:complete
MSVADINMSLDAIVESITCPITGVPMVEPVIGKDGHTYERGAILEWLSRNPISPQTRESMVPTDLKVNPAIRFLCDKYHSGAFGDENNTGSTTPPKISADSIKLDHSITKNADNKTMLTFNIDPNSIPEQVEGQVAHLSQDVVLVIDHSGSMNAAVEAKDDKGDNLENGMSVQDIVNHAANTIAKTLDKNSRLAVIMFDNHITTVFELMLMTEMNCTRAMSEISAIKPACQTNIWGGIDAAIKMLNARDDKTRNGHIVMLTDGSPNISPARGEIATLRRLRKTLNFTASIYTFGFGYALSRGLLYDLAKYANGGNGHIPDGGMIATVFCNYIGTILATIVVNMQLHITYSEDVNFAELEPVMGDYAYNVDQGNQRYVIVDLGTVQLGQMRNIVMNTSHLTQPFSYFYTYKIGGQPYKSDTAHVQIEELDLNESDMNIHIARYNTVELMRKIINYRSINSVNEAIQCYGEMEAYYTSRSSLNDELSQNILENIKDQIKMASTDSTFYKRWGEFYMDQLSRALNQQQKPNFKDQACMSFGDSVFDDIVDKASDVFDLLPPPEPSLINHPIPVNPTNYRSGGTTATPPIIPRRVATLAAYNNSSGPCFDGNCTITLADGSTKILKNLQKNDEIMSVDIVNNDKITTAKVVCILETKMRTGVAELVNFKGGLIITPWHPIKTLYGWQYPNDIGDSVMQPCESVFSLVLDTYHVALINNIACICLGHNFTEGILQHDYYGTHKIIKDMEKMIGWETGHIVVYDGCVLKSSNIASKIVQNKIRALPQLIDAF